MLWTLSIILVGVIVSTMILSASILIHVCANAPEMDFPEPYERSKVCDCPFCREESRKVGETYTKRRKKQ